MSLVSPALAGRFFTSAPHRKPIYNRFNKVSILPKVVLISVFIKYKYAWGKKRMLKECLGGEET